MSPLNLLAISGAVFVLAIAGVMFLNFKGMTNLTGFSFDEEAGAFQERFRRHRTYMAIAAPLALLTYISGGALVASFIFFLVDKYA